MTRARPRNKAAGWRRARGARRAAQVLSFLLFLALFVYANAQRPLPFWPDLFSRLDPLAMAAASLAGRVALGGLLLAAGVFLLTLLFGRVWCGWLCPLGSVLGWLGPRGRRVPRAGAPPETLRSVKFLLLAAIAAAAVLGNLTLLVFDPITILNRTMAVAAWPALRHAVVQAEDLLYQFSFLWGVLDAVHEALVQPLFLSVPSAFALAPWVALTFVTLVALNWKAERFWCRYLCPLGGLLGLVARAALWRREAEDGCAGCGRCAAACPTGTIDPANGHRSDPAECIVCLDCAVDCPLPGRDGPGFRWRVRPWRPAPRQAYDPTRRQVLAALGAGAVGVALAGVEPITLRQPATMIRPPGAVPADLAARCIRCAACIRVCPTQGLQPSLFEGGVQNVATPRLVPRLGFCDFGCNACGQVCPSGAIPELALEVKQRTVIGLARVDRDRCLPWAYGVACIVCEESCPVADKAIELEDLAGTDGEGEPTVLQRPRVVKERCIGCGVCEAKCPMGGEAAIRVYAPTAAGSS